MEEARQAEVIIYSPGGIQHSSLLVRCGFLTPEELRDLWDRGARANVLSRLVDEEGRALSEELERRTLGLPLQALREARISLAVGGGEEKIPAFTAALKGGLTNVVITDSLTAEALVA